MTDLRASARDLRALHDEMLSAAPEEAAAFVYAEPSGDALVMKGYRVFGRHEMDAADAALSIDEDVQADALAAVKRSGHSLIDVHTHPFSDDQVRFSSFDLEQLPAFARYVRLKMPGRPVGALVLGRRGYDGLLWRSDAPEPLRVVPVGACEESRELQIAGESPTNAPGEARFDRQVRALGAAGQARLRNLRVAIVGLGGTGSQIVQQLAHLGVRDFILVDDDRVDLTNLPRLAGARWWDATFRTRKTQVAARQIRRLGRGAVVRRIAGLRSREALHALRGVDLIVGCVDNDGARLIMSEFAAAHLVPYLDIGVSITRVDEDAWIGGRVAFHVPSGPCLACADEIDFAEAGHDLESEALRGIRLERGYAEDRAVEPALMPLNTVCVGLAMVELLAFVTGVRPVQPFARYDANSDRIVIGRVERNPGCPVCIPAHGMGDRQGIERYAV